MKVVLAGYGTEGVASFEYWTGLGHEVSIADEKDSLDNVPPDTSLILGPDAFTRLDSFDLIVRSPSINPDKLSYADKVWSATNEFFAKCPAPIIGVTGTKGKGTTSSLIASVLKAANKTVHLVGNIGTPALGVLNDIKPGDFVVFEMSSFQLWDIKRSPHVAVVLGIEPDHLDVHNDMSDYIFAKSQIASHQTSKDVIVFNKNNEYATKIASRSPGEKIEYPFDIAQFEPSLKIPGPHNVENASAAVAVCRQLGIDDDCIRAGFEVFGGLPHRLKFVREIEGVRYYDDSIATTPGSAVAAVSSFPDTKITLILGGREKGADYAELLQLCRDRQVTLLLIGENRKKMAGLCLKYDVDYSVEAGSMSEIVNRAREEVESGVVILSPAATSFDMFANYADRGDQFIDAVNKLS